MTKTNKGNGSNGNNASEMTGKERNGKIDVPKMVTDKIVAALESGVNPWSRPWDASNAPREIGSGFLPYNGFYGRTYGGVNALILWATANDRGYSDNRWFTPKQVNKMGAEWNEGERYNGTEITFWKTITKTEEDEVTGEKTTKRFPMCRFYYVFNACQLTNLPAKYQPEVIEDDDDNSEMERIGNVEYLVNVIAENDIEHKQGGKRAFYNPKNDFTKLPLFKYFKTAEGYYATRLHEIAHATGHDTRLNRNLTGRFGTESYAMEELIAEMASAFVTATLGINADLENHASYVASWIKVLKNDKYAIFTAAREAEEAANYIMGYMFLEMDEDEDTDNE